MILNFEQMILPYKPFPQFYMAFHDIVHGMERTQSIGISLSMLFQAMRNKLKR